MIALSSPASMPSPWLRPSEISPCRSWRITTWVWPTMFCGDHLRAMGLLRSNVESLQVICSVSASAGRPAAVTRVPG